MCLDLYVIRDPNCIGYCCQKPENLLQKISIAAEAGFDFIEVWHKDIIEFKNKFGLSPFIEKIKELNIKVASLKVLNNWFIGDDSLALVDLAKDINAEILVVKLVPDEYFKSPIDLDHCIKRYNKLLSISNEKNIKPAIEFMALAKYMNKIDDVYKILDFSQGENKCLVLDTWHLWRNDDEQFTNFIKTINNLNIDWAGIVHFTDAAKNIHRTQQKDGDRRMPTQGCLNLSKFSDVINNMGFSGYYSLNVYDKNLWNYDNLQTAVSGKYYMLETIFSNKILADSNLWSNNQQTRCDALWAKNYKTHLDPRIKKTIRDQILIQKLESYLKDKYVLDFKCGFSPLAELVSEGFDASNECISYLKRKYPNKKWHNKSDQEFSNNFFNKIDVLLHIGLGDSNTEEDSHMLIRKNCKPELVIIECAADENKQINESKIGNRTRWENLKKGLKIIEEFDYETDMADRKYRKLIVAKL